MDRRRITIIAMYIVKEGPAKGVFRSLILIVPKITQLLNFARKTPQLFCASEAIYFRSALQDLLNGIPSRHLIGPSHRDGVEVRLHFCSRFNCPSEFFLSVSSPSRSDQKGDLEMRRDVASITSPTRVAARLRQRASPSPLEKF